ncbi:MAG: hypothetical protein IJ699_10045 [Bacteroidaceae bacterium]|nr:hypothetical protein [Bacteroidaceae bacterium]MBR1666543.1 hypothetical protein [Bacteroidaceae bacterium]
MPTSKEELLRRGLTPHDIQHNQHRRALWQDYAGSGLYMITLCVEGRSPLFGHLEGDIKAPRGQASFPHIVLSQLGNIILTEELPKLHRLYPQIELWQASIMPDHLHLLLHVAAPLPPNKKLGDILRLFKGGCTRAWWHQTFQTSTTVPAPSSATVPAPSSAVSPSPSPSPPLLRPSLFEPGYHDRIIKRPGMLDTIKRYMADNPLRALMRKRLPHLLERRLHLRIGTRDYAAFGALFLLKRAEKEQVFYHRRDSATGLPTEQTDTYRHEHDRQLSEAREGVVLVSPAISPGERLIINAAINEALPVIQLQKEPIMRYWKPERRRFEACARGTLLILAPWGLDEDLMKTAHQCAGTSATAPPDYARFHHLNDLAAEICATTDVSLLNLSDIIIK